MEQAVILEHFVQNALTLSSLCCALHALAASGVTRRSVWVTGIGGGVGGGAAEGGRRSIFENVCDVEAR